ncbi:MAG TPA: hypothetical protein PLA93_12895, partial [Acinetobacter towneri]|nr:hypothetical protein [Acinetobacter towneri]
TRLKFVKFTSTLTDGWSPLSLGDRKYPKIRVYIRTDSDKLSNKAGQTFEITLGMVATVDIKTGEKTVLDYLIKPFNKAKEALRER